MTFFITFACYGSHIHGAPDGSVDRRHNRYQGPLVDPNPRRLAAESHLMHQPPYQMDEPRRRAVLEAIIDRCALQDWGLVAAHIRSNHVHVIVQGKDSAEFVMTRLKTAASRRLNELGFEDRTRKRWARHGSTRMLFTEASVQHAVRYVLEGQGEAMSAFQGVRAT
jgi:REP element-mobilizing transposase RayT